MKIFLDGKAELHHVDKLYTAIAELNEFFIDDFQVEVVSTKEKPISSYSSGHLRIINLSIKLILKLMS